MKTYLVLLGTVAWLAMNAQAQNITQQPTNQVVDNGGTAVFSVSVSGTGPFTYQWQFNGTNLNSIITTVAGGAGSGLGDGGPATNAFLREPDGMAVDYYGNLFIADYGNNRIRKVDTNGVITTVAGGGNFPPSTGRAATNTMLNEPGDVKLDSSGNLYIAEYGGNQVLKVGTNGIITVVAGNGRQGYSGDGGPGTNAELAVPNSLAFDSNGNLFIADWGDNHVREITTNGIITSVAGNGTNGFSGDGGAATNAELSAESVAVDSYDNLFIADNSNGRVREVNTIGIITTIAGGGINYPGDGGPATNAAFRFIVGVAVDGSDNVFIADQDQFLVREIGSNGIITSAAGNGTHGYSGDGGSPTNAEVGSIWSLTLSPHGNLFVADAGYARVRKVTWTTLPTLELNNISTNNIGNYSVVINYSGGSVTSSVATLNIPATIVSQPENVTALVGGSATFAVAAAGLGPMNYQWMFDGASIPGATNTSYTISNVSSNNGGLYSVIVTNPGGSSTSASAALSVAYISEEPIDQLTTNGGMAAFSVLLSALGDFSYQWQINGTNLPFCGAITTVAGNGTSGFSGDGGAATNSQIWVPNAIAVDDAGNLFVTDTGNNRIRKISTNGIISTIAGGGTSPFLTVDGDGGPATNAEIRSPESAAVDGSGNLFIADANNQRIRKVTTNGIITTVAGNGKAGYSGDGGTATSAELSSPWAVAVDSTGDLFIADEGNNRIREVNINGVITTVAGNGTNGYSGDGGAATNAELSNPYDVTLDSYGNLFIADTYNQRIREIGSNGIITTVAGNGAYGYSGDGGAATNAQLWYPESVAVDGFGNFFVADQGNQCIREVANGIISTVAGNDATGYAGDGGMATNAELNYPQGVCLSGGNLYIADTDNERIRMVTDTPIGPIFALSNISNANAGNYSAVISYGGTSLTSSVVTLSVVPLIIKSQPQNTSAILTSNATFSVTASGSGPLAYQWFFDNTNEVPGTTNLFTLADVQATNAGYYSVVITNMYGSVTSCVAGLTVTLPPIVPSFTQTNGNLAFEFSWSVLPGLTYQVQYTTNLFDGVWTDLGGPVTTTNDAGPFLDIINTNPERFYRVVLVQ